MDTDQRIVVEGVVKEKKNSGMCVVELADGRCIEAEISGKIRVRFMEVSEGARVQCEISPFDPAKARIIASIK